MHQSSGFLNRVRWFDSGRGHPREPFSEAPSRHFRARPRWRDLRPSTSGLPGPPVAFRSGMFAPADGDGSVCRPFSALALRSRLFEVCGDPYDLARRNCRRSRVWWKVLWIAEVSPMQIARNDDTPLRLQRLDHFPNGGGRSSREFSSEVGDRRGSQPFDCRKHRDLAIAQPTVRAHPRSLLRLVVVVGFHAFLVVGMLGRAVLGRPSTAALNGRRPSAAHAAISAATASSARSHARPSAVLTSLRDSPRTARRASRFLVTGDQMRSRG